MQNFIYVQSEGGTKIAINVNSIVSVIKVSSDTSYIDYYSFDYEGSASFRIDRITVRQSFDDIRNLIME